MPSNPFETLGVPARFDLDEAHLHERFIAAAAATHPDRYSDPLEQADAAQRAAELNQAYETLQDPETRANALLELSGGSTQSDDKSLPSGFLMEVMEARESIEQAVDEGDTVTQAKLRDWAHQQRELHLHQIAELFRQAQDQPQEERQPVMDQIRLELNALRYFQRMIEQTDPA